jgi:hypothetical protein
LVEQRLLAPAALRLRAAQPPGSGAVDDQLEAGGEIEREREARTQGHRPVCGGPEARARGDWEETGGEAADAVAEITGLSAAACVARGGSERISGRWSGGAARKTKKRRRRLEQINIRFI